MASIVEAICEGTVLGRLGLAADPGFNGSEAQPSVAEDENHCVLHCVQYHTSRIKRFLERHVKPMWWSSVAIVCQRAQFAVFHPQCL